MATEETVNIIDLDIDQDELIKKLTTLDDKIKGLKDETKELQAINDVLAKGNRKNTEQYKQNAAQIEINKAQTKSLSGEYRTNQNTLTALTASEKGQLGTLEQLAIRNKELRNEVKTLDLTQASGRKRLVQINGELDKNNKFIKNNADAYLKQKINIGNYQSALQGLPGPLAGAARGSQVLLQAFRALIANPIGLILAAIALAIKAIADAISKNQAALDRFKAIGDGIRASYDAVLDRINAVGRSIKRLGDINFKNIIGGFKGIGEEMVEEFKAAKQLREELQKLEDQEIGDIVRKSELRREIELLRLATKDENLSNQERVDMLDKAIAKEIELSDIEVEAARERARISQEQIDLGDSTRKEIEENALLQAKVIDLETASIKLRRSLAAERLGLVRKAAKDELEAVKELVDKTLKEYERIEKPFLQGLEDAESDLESFLERSNENFDELVESWDRAEKQKTNILDKEIEKRNQAEVTQFNLAKMVQETKLDLAQGYLQGISALFGQETAVGKAAAVAETAINTYRSATAAYAALAGIPVVGPGLGIAAAGAAVISGLANVKKILAVKTPGAENAGGGGVSLPSGGGATRTATYGLTPTYNVSTSDSGITIKTLVNTTASAVKQGVMDAFNESPPRNVLVVDRVTEKQQGINAIEKTATV
jgi:hypothetical protein